MDPDVARMIADLGNNRREDISVAEGQKKGAGPRVPDAVLAAEAEEHRQRHLRAGGHTAAWNTPATFGGDSRAEALQNYYDGQGHRAALQQTVRGHRGYEEDNAPRARSGFVMNEERRQYLAERQGGERYAAFSQGGQNYTTAPSRPAAPARDPNRQRAASPRSHGTVRYGPGGRRVAPQPAFATRATSPRAHGTVRFDANGRRVVPKLASATRASSPRAHGTVRFNSNGRRADKPAAASRPPPPTVQDTMAQSAIARFKALTTSATSFLSGSSSPSASPAPSAPPPTAPVVQQTPVEVAQEAPVVVKAEPELPAKVEPEPSHVSAPQSSTQLTNVQKPVPAIKHEHSSSESSTRSNSTDNSASTALSEPMPSMDTAGTLAATYYGIDGNCLGDMQYPIDAPVQANITITSKLRRYDPRELAVAIMRLAKDMYDRSHGMDGYKISDDLWEEDDGEIL